jgi:hypothetical protein
MAAPRRLRTRSVQEAEPAPESRARTALRRRLHRTEEAIPLPARRGASAPVDSQVVTAPNTDYPLGEIIDRVRYDMRPARPGDHLHVSDLLHKCIRKKAIENRFGVVPAQQRLSMSDILTFAMGDAVHDTVKERARMGAPDKVWGIWSCKCEYLKHDDPCVFADIDQEETCPHCNSLVNKYHEVSMFDEEYGIVGNPDLVLYFPRKDALHVTEVKSIAHKGWEELVRPDPKHVLQVVFYWHLMHRKGYKLTDRVSIFYVTKQWQFGDKTVYKEFLVDPVTSVVRLAPYIEDAKAYKAALASDTVALPLRTFCAHIDAKPAKACNVSGICWE